MIQAVHALSAATLAEPGATALGVVPWVFVAGLAVALGALYRQLTAAKQQIVQGETALREAVQKQENKQQKTKREHSEREATLRDAKQESAAQRKKNHVAQEEIKQLREQLREQTRLRLEAQNSRPAFAEPVERPAPPPPKPAPKPEPEPVIVAQPSAEQEAALAKLQQSVDRLQANHQSLQEQLATERTAAAEARNELKKQRKRAEDFRRIDIITKSKMEVLEDRLRHMGREYYEAISEVAALKGHVAPPRLRDLPPERDPQPDADADAEQADDADTSEPPSASTEPANAGHGNEPVSAAASN